MPPPVIVGPRCNRRVTCDSSASNARSESAVAVNPLDPYHLVASSKRFTNPATYAFSNQCCVSFDGGITWTDSAPLALLPGWAGTSDPAVCFDDLGAAYLLALPFGPSGNPADFVGPIQGMAVYRSVDGGRTWGTPTLIHASTGDDKQWIAADVGAASPRVGNLYGVWHNAGQLYFTRSTDHGATWRGVGTQPGPSTVPGVADCFSPEVSVSRDGTIYVVWLAAAGLATPAIKIVKSTNGGDSFSEPGLVADGITPIPFQLPGARFRTFTLATGCAGAGNLVVFAWADYREGVSRIYYRRSMNGGNSFAGPASGSPLLTGAEATPAGLHDFHPQIIATPDGEIGCAFYEYGPHGGGEFPPKLIDVVLAVSTNDGASFANRVTVTDQAWDPTVNEVYAHGDSNVTFIGEYFGLDASRLGFFPLWTDTRTGVQQLFASRIAVRPADVYIRDSGTDTGGVPSPGFHWEAPDLVVRRAADGASPFANEDLLRDGVTNHYLYGRVTNAGPNEARGVRLAVTIGNWPALGGLPGSEFRFPQDWYPGHWTTPALQANHIWLGESPPQDIPAGGTRILGPVEWPAGQIPAPGGTWHPCVLAEVRADNDDSLGGTNGCGVDADPDPCVFSAYFWGVNNVCQRNLSYAPVAAGVAALVELPFVLGSPFGRARLLEAIVEKGRDLAGTPMRLRIEPLTLDQPPEKECGPGELVWIEGGGRVVIRVDGCQAGELVPAAGTVWRPLCPSGSSGEEKPSGASAGVREWTLDQERASAVIPTRPGALWKGILSFHTPASLKPGTRTLVRIFQRNDRRLITGSVMLELAVRGAADVPPTR